MIYCVEDDTNIRNLMLYTLNAAGFQAVGFEDAGSFYQALESRKPRLVVLDIMLPGEDGIAILSRLRSQPDTQNLPVIMATARSSEFDKVQGLDLGADDYLTKPFGMMEMVSRIKAVLRRTEPKAKHTLCMDTLCLDLSAHTATLDGKTLQLTLKEYALLRLLLESPGQVFTRDALLAKVWDMEFAGESRTVDVHIGTLRTKLGAFAQRIQTVRGVGYRLEDKL